MIVENDTEALQDHRRTLVEMMFVEGNHFCMFCEKSGNCELQALAYRLQVVAPTFPFLFPRREVDATHPDILIDHNRCILCARCVRTSRDVDGKQVFDFVVRSRDDVSRYQLPDFFGGPGAGFTTRPLIMFPA
jgi:[NiFe] hydrogenase diaphorase moiety small subunit